MNPYKPTKIEWISFFVLMPVLCVAINYLLFGENYLDRNVLLKSYPVVFVYGFASWYLHILVMHLLRLGLPGFSDTSRRLLILLTSHILLTSGTLFLIFWSYDLVNYLGYVIDPAKARWCLVIAILLTLTATSTWEGSYIYQLWKDSVREKELLQKSNLQSEFDSLKTQVNPHFLFNSLNSLSSLIHENPKDAELFLDEMSKVYRYILKNNHQELIDLHTELDFLHSYHHLLRTRYNKGLHVSIDVTDGADYFLPPLTLHVLVENAVKHNIILKEKPLYITITRDGQERIVVKNNIQKKSVKVISGQEGLVNIAAKYKLLNQPEVIISENGTEFSVSIPLIR